jgi:hypothetical protein
MEERGMRDNETLGEFRFRALPTTGSVRLSSWPIRMATAWSSTLTGPAETGPGKTTRW